MSPYERLNQKKETEKEIKIEEGPKINPEYGVTISEFPNKVFFFPKIIGENGGKIEVVINQSGKTQRMHWIELAEYIGVKEILGNKDANLENIKQAWKIKLILRENRYKELNQEYLHSHVRQKWVKRIEKVFQNTLKEKIGLEEIFCSPKSDILDQCDSIIKTDTGYLGIQFTVANNEDYLADKEIKLNDSTVLPEHLEYERIPSVLIKDKKRNFYDKNALVIEDNKIIEDWFNQMIKWLKTHNLKNDPDHQELYERHIKGLEKAKEEFIEKNPSE